MGRDLAVQAVLAVAAVAVADQVGKMVVTPFVTLSLGGAAHMAAAVHGSLTQEVTTQAAEA